MSRRQSTTKPAREVTGLKSMAELIGSGWSFGLSPEPPVVREHMDGTWSVHYPEEGWVQTSIGQQWPYTESAWPGATGEDPHDLEAAIAHARFISGKEPKVEPLTDRARKRQETMAAA